MIARLEQNDIEEVGDIWLSNNITAHFFIPDSYWKQNLLDVKKAMLEAEVYIFQEEEKILGFIGLEQENIAGIFVRAENQSQGIGKQLLDFCKQKRIKLILNVYQKNPRAIQFYQREGFEIIQEGIDEQTGEKEYQMIWKRKNGWIEDKIKSLGDKFELVDFYIDDGYTGLNTNRPNFQRMLNDIERKRVNCVITKDLSRLSRNNFEANYYIELYFLEREIRYIAILDNVDTYLKNSNNDMIQF